MAGDFRGQHDLDELLVDADVRMRVVQLVEGGDHAVAKRHIRLQQATDQYLLGERRADTHQYLRQLASDFERGRRFVEQTRQLRHERIAVLRQPGHRIGCNVGACERADQGLEDVVAHHD